MTQTPEELFQYLADLCPEGPEVLDLTSHIPSQMLPWQRLALCYHAKDAQSIFEIGTFVGCSAAIMATANPDARIVTCNPSVHEYQEALLYLAPHKGVSVWHMASWDVDPAEVGAVDLVFVDGDHKRVVRDLVWFNSLLPNGTILFHDYSPAACPPVFDAVNRMAESLGREAPDFVLLDDAGIGMAGIRRYPGESWRDSA